MRCSLLQLLCGRRRNLRSRGTLVGALALLIVGTACTDSTVAPNSVSPRASGDPNCIDPTQPGCDPNGGGGGYDPGGGINPNDSYVVGDLTVQSSTTVTLGSPIYDPVTDQSTTSFTEWAPDEHMHVAAGYSTDGATIVNSSFTDPVDPNTSPSIQVTEAGLYADNLTESNSASQQMADQQPSDATAETPMHIVGSTQNANVTAGAIVDLTDTTTVNSSATINSGAPTRPGSPQIVARAAAAAERSGPQDVEVDGRYLRVEVTRQQQLQLTELSGTGSEISAAPRGGVKHWRLFDRRGSSWILAEVHTELDDDNGTRKLHESHVIKLRHTRVFRNRKLDAARAEARPSTEWMPISSSRSGVQPGSSSGSGLQPVSSSGSGVHAMLVACGDECNGGGGYVASGPQALGADLGCGQNVVGQVNSSGTVDLLYQHGIWSDATTWCAMDPYLRTRFLVHNEIRHSLNSRAYYEDQASDLQSRFSTDILSYPGSYVYVGHSNGGIVSRLAAQRMQGSGVRGVVTVSSPQDGAPLASVGREALAAAIALPFLSNNFACNLVSHLVCTVAQHLGDNTAVDGLLGILAPIIVHSSSPVTDESTVHNGFYANLNNGSEPFAHAAVINKSWDKWTEWRLYGDFHCALYTECDGRHVVARADRTYHRYLKCAVVGGIFAFFIPGAGPVAAVCGSSAAQMKGYDLIYKRLSVGHDSGDGIVPLGSQQYPSRYGAGQYVVPDADSHLGVTASTGQTGPRIADAIHQQVGVPFAQ